MRGRRARRLWQPARLCASTTRTTRRPRAGALRVASAQATSRQSRRITSSPESTSSRVASRIEGAHWLEALPQPIRQPQLRAGPRLFALRAARAQPCGTGPVHQQGQADQFVEPNRLGHGRRRASAVRRTIQWCDHQPSCHRNHPLPSFAFVVVWVAPGVGAEGSHRAVLGSGCPMCPSGRGRFPTPGALWIREPGVRGCASRCVCNCHTGSHRPLC